MTHDTTTLLRDLARAKAAFQLRTIEAIITEGRDKPAPVLRQPDMLEGL